MKKTVLITGSSTGIGRASAMLFAKNNWNVIATMRAPELEIELNQLENVLVIRLDIEDVASIKEAIAKAILHFGKLDLLVNNAAFGQYGLFEALTAEQIEKQFQVNVFGTMNVIREVLPHFRAQKEGAIINVSSAGGRIGLPLISLYVSSKFAIEGFSEALSYELKSQNISVKLIEPGGVDTPFHVTSTKLFAIDNGLNDYNDFVLKASTKLDELGSEMSSAADVANTIMLAATDDSPRLRYSVGKDAKAWIGYRTSMDDDQFSNYMSEFFNIR